MTTTPGVKEDALARARTTAAAKRAVVKDVAIDELVRFRAQHTTKQCRAAQAIAIRASRQAGQVAGAVAVDILAKHPLKLTRGL